MLCPLLLMPTMFRAHPLVVSASHSDQLFNCSTVQSIWILHFYIYRLYFYSFTYILTQMGFILTTAVMEFFTYTPDNLRLSVYKRIPFSFFESLCCNKAGQGNQVPLPFVKASVAAAVTSWKEADNWELGQLGKVSVLPTHKLFNFRKMTWFFWVSVSLAIKQMYKYLLH